MKRLFFNICCFAITAHCAASQTLGNSIQKKVLHSGRRKQLSAGGAKGKTSPAVKNSGSFLLEELVEQQC